MKHLKWLSDIVVFSILFFGVTNTYGSSCEELARLTRQQLARQDNSVPRTNAYQNANRGIPAEENSLMSRYPDLDEETFRVHSYAVDTRVINANGDKTVGELVENIVNANRAEVERLRGLATKYADDPILSNAFGRAADNIKVDMNSSTIQQLGGELFDPTNRQHLGLLGRFESDVIGAQGELMALARVSNPTATSATIENVYGDAASIIRARSPNIDKNQLTSFLQTEIDIVAGSRWIEVKHFQQTITRDFLENHGKGKSLVRQLERQRELRRIFEINDGALELHATAGGITQEAADYLQDLLGVQSVGVVP